MLEISILGFLYEQNQCGYELNKRISSLMGYYTNISDGSLYPAIKRLEKKEFLTRKNTAPKGSRVSYILELTESGRTEFYNRLKNPKEIQISDRNKYFTIMAFLHNLNRNDQLEVLNRRMNFISKKKKGFFYEGKDPMLQKDVHDPFKKGMYEIAKATEKAEKQWLAGVIEELTVKVNSC